MAAIAFIGMHAQPLPDRFAASRPTFITRRRVTPARRFAEYLQMFRRLYAFSTPHYPRFSAADLRFNERHTWLTRRRLSTLRDPAASARQRFPTGALYVRMLGYQDQPA